MGFLDKLSDKITGANIPPPPPSNDWFEEEAVKKAEQEPEENKLEGREIPASAESYLSGDVFTVKFITVDDTDYGGAGKVDISGTAQVRLTADSMHRTAASSQIRQMMIAQAKQTMLNMCENGVPYELLHDHEKMAALAITNRFESDEYELVNVNICIGTEVRVSPDKDDDQ